MDEFKEPCSFFNAERTCPSFSTIARRETSAGVGRSGLARLARRFLVEGSTRDSGVAFSNRLKRVSRVETSFDEAEERMSAV